MRVSNTLLKPDGTAPDARYLLDGAVTRPGRYDSGGVMAEDVPSGPYTLTETIGDLVVSRKIYAPTLEGPFSVAKLLTKRPDKHVVMVGAAGTLHGIEAMTVSDDEDPITTISPGSWTWHAGKGIGWCEFYDGLLFMCGQDQTLNSLTPTGTELLVSIFDPRTNDLSHQVIPTTLGYRSVIGSNGVTGGAYCADVAAVPVGSETWMTFLSSNPYNGWQVATYGEYPLLSVFRKVGGVWSYDASKSITATQLHNANALGADAFPLATDAWGTTYGQALLADELEVTPVSKMLVMPQYARNPNYPSFYGGSIVVIDPVNRSVRARYVIEFQGDPTCDQICPRSVMVDPTSSADQEIIVCVFDCFKGGVDAGFNVFQAFVYTHSTGTIRPLSNWISTVADGADHFTNGGFTGNGDLVLSRRTGLTVKPTYIYPKVDGFWKWSQDPHSWSGSGIFAQVCEADFSVSHGTGQGAYSNVRARWDPLTSVMWLYCANFNLVGIKVEGDAHVPRYTRLKTVTFEVNEKLKAGGSPEPGILWPMDGALDLDGRAGYFPILQLGGGAQLAQRNQYLAIVDLDRVGATPSFGKSVNLEQIAKTEVTPTLPDDWQPGNAVYIFLTVGLLTGVAGDPVVITAPQTWTKDFEVRNGATGDRHLLCHRVMASGDSAPTLSWSSSLNPTLIAWAVKGPHPTSPTDQGTNVMTSALSTLERPSVTPAAAGRRIFGIYSVKGRTDFTVGLGEVTPGEILRVNAKQPISGGLTAALTEEEQLFAGAALPTWTRRGSSPIADLAIAATIAVAPNPAPAAPPGVLSVSLSPSTVNGGQSSDATVTLVSAATVPTEVTVRVSGTSKAHARSYTLVIPAGSSSGVVTIDTDNVTGTTVATVIARTLANVSADLTINAVAPFVTGLLTYTTVAVPSCPRHTNDLHARVFYPGSGGPYPIIYAFNGAGFAHTSGIDSSSDPFYRACQQFAANGYVVFGGETHGYNCGLLATQGMPGGGPGSWGSVADAEAELCGKALVAYGRANAGTYGGDTTREATFGFSAGGHMAHILGITQPGIDVAIGFSSLPSAQELVSSADALAHYESYVGTSDLTSDAYHFADGAVRVGASSPLMVMYNSTAELIPSGCMTGFGTVCAALGVPYRTTLIPGSAHASYGNHVFTGSDVRAGTYTYPAPTLGVDTVWDDVFHLLDAVF